MTLFKILREAYDNYCRRFPHVESPLGVFTFPFDVKYKVPEINATFRTSRIASYFTAALYLNGRTPKDIRRIGRTLRARHRDLIDDFDRRAHDGLHGMKLIDDANTKPLCGLHEMEEKAIIFDIVAHQDDKDIPKQLDMLAEMRLKAPEKISLFPEVYDFFRKDDNKFNDPVAYLHGLTKNQTSALLSEEEDDRRWMLEEILPSYFDKAGPLKIFRSADRRSAFLGNDTTGTLDLFFALSPNERTALFPLYSALEAGIILRQFKYVQPKGYTRLKEDVHKTTGGRFFMTAEMEDDIKGFVYRYARMNEDGRKKITQAIHLQRQTPGSSSRIIKYTNKYWKNPNQLDAAVFLCTHFEHNSDINNIVNNDSLVSQYAYSQQHRCLDKWMNLLGWTGPEKLSQIPLHEYAAAIRAFNYVKNDKERTAFINGFLANVDRSTVGAWANTIIKYHKTKAVGGDNYHRREVIAA
jgi:hypothetical protein